MNLNHNPSLCEGMRSRRNRGRDWEESCYWWVFQLAVLCNPYLWVQSLAYGLFHPQWVGPSHNNLQQRQLPQECPQTNLVETISQLSQDENKTQLKYPISCQLDTQTHHCKIITISFLIVSKILWLHFTQNAVELYTSQLSKNSKAFS